MEMKWKGKLVKVIRLNWFSHTKLVLINTCSNTMSMLLFFGTVMTFFVCFDL